MQLQFNKQMLHLQVVCGVLEEFKPNKKVKELHTRLNELQKKTVKFQKEVLFPELEEIDKEVNLINESEIKKKTKPKKTKENTNKTKEQK